MSTLAVCVPVLWLDALEDEGGGVREQAAVEDFLRHHEVRSVPRSRQEGVEVLLVGRLVAKKGPIHTWSACVKAWGAGARLRVTVIGDGPLMAQMFCQHSLVNVETGDEEGLPVAILEAMAHGVPVVATRHAGIPEAVEDGVSGLLVDEEDIDGMADRIRLLASDADLRDRLGAAARDRVLSHFTWAAEREALLALLDVDR